jgi:predicted metal-dependent phosphoesterase TrpH
MRFDLHIHSKHSPDSNSSVKDIIGTAKARGLNGISITDHNSFSGSEEALMLETDDFLIIPGCEYSTDQGHLLAYFLKSGLENKGFKRDNKGRFHWQDIVEGAHDQDAAVFMAHPHKYMKVHDTEIWNQIDGIEVYNSRASLCRNINANLQAFKTSQLYSKAFSAGSDAHWLDEIGHAFFECTLKDSFDKSESLSQIKSALLNSNGKVWGSVSHRLYEPASQIFKCFKTSNYTRLPRPLAKMTYACVLESVRYLGMGEKAYEGWIELEKEKGV